MGQQLIQRTVHDWARPSGLIQACQRGKALRGSSGCFAQRFLLFPQQLSLPRETSFSYSVLGGERPVNRSTRLSASGDIVDCVCDLRPNQSVEPRLLHHLSLGRGDRLIMARIWVASPPVQRARVLSRRIAVNEWSPSSSDVSPRKRRRWWSPRRSCVKIRS